MAKKVILLTPEGLASLETELENLKTIVRKEVAEKIKVARSFGDLSENSEYDEAKNEQAIIEARIVEIEMTLKNAKIVDEDDVSTDYVSVGTYVKVSAKYPDEDEATVEEYKVVGSTEASPAKMRISDESPVGMALIGHRVGDNVEVETPGGNTVYTILEINKH